MVGHSARHWDTTMMKLECPTVLIELVPRGKGVRQVKGSAVNPRSGQKLKRNIKEL